MKRRFALGATIIVALSAGTTAIAKEFDDDWKPPYCTLVGCSSGFSVMVKSAPPGTRFVDLCVGAVCERGLLDRHESRRAAEGKGWAPTRLETRVNGDEPLYVTVVTRAADGRQLSYLERALPTEKSRPNGEDCAPVCFGAGRVLVARGTELADFSARTASRPSP
jgi:hypothetical protein